MGVKWRKLSIFLGVGIMVLQSKLDKSLNKGFLFFAHKSGKALDAFGRWVWLQHGVDGHVCTHNHPQGVHPLLSTQSEVIQKPGLQI